MRGFRASPASVWVLALGTCLGACLGTCLRTSPAFAQSPDVPSKAESPVVVDRVAVRFTTPETGGVARPQFITDRQLALVARFEAMFERVPMPEGEYGDRYVRVAIDRLIARTMLAALLQRRGEEPPNLPRLTTEARGELEDRLGGAGALSAALAREGIAESELTLMLREQARAAWYIAEVITPIDAVTEDSLLEAYRSAAHPYRGLRYEDVHDHLRRWVRAERFRAAELEFLQSARSRVTIVAVRPIATPVGASGR